MRIGLLLGSVVVSVVTACGFDARPTSGVVACNPQGPPCCPHGYLCVGHGVTTESGPSAGTCWHKDDLPVLALVHSHDLTPGLSYDPACLVTDWLPAAASSDAGVAEDPIPPVEETIDAAVLEDPPSVLDGGEG